LIDEVIKKAYHELEAHNWTNEELRAYEASEKSSKDAKSREKYVEQAAREKALKEGREEGREEGKLIEKKQIALTMLSNKLDEKIVAESTSLSLEVIKKLKNNLVPKT